MGFSSYITDSYTVIYKETEIGTYQVIFDGTHQYNTYSCKDKLLKKELANLKLNHNIVKKDGPIPFFDEIIQSGTYDPQTREFVCHGGPDGQITLKRDRRVCDIFWVYRSWAEKGAPDYSEKGHVWSNGENTEWVTGYSFNKYNDGTFEVEMEECYRNGPHDMGGPIRKTIPEAWFSLPYDEFLDKVLGLTYAYAYNFTLQDLKARDDLRSFFGFKEVK